MTPIQKPVRSKYVASFEPCQLRGKCAAILLPSWRLMHSYRKYQSASRRLRYLCPPLRRSARLQEKNVNRKVEYRKISRWQSSKKAKIREIKQRGQLQMKSKNAESKKGFSLFNIIGIIIANLSSQKRPQYQAPRPQSASISLFKSTNTKWVLVNYFPCQGIRFIHVDAGKLSQTRDEQEITQG